MDARGLALAAVGGVALFLFGRSAQAAQAPAIVAPGWEPGYPQEPDWGAPQAPGDAWAAPWDWAPSYPGGEWDTLPAPLEPEPVYPGGEWDVLPEPVYPGGEWDILPEPAFPGGEWDILPEPVYVETGGQYYPARSLTMSPVGLDFLKRQEGFSSVPYWDVKGYSIGYGHFMGPVATMDYVSREQGEALLIEDLSQYETAIRENVAVPLTQGQFDALTDFTYNLGVSAFLQSTLLRLLNAGDYAGAANEFGRWINAGGAPSPTLIARRAAEVEMFTA
jgi:lysozyme